MDDLNAARENALRRVQKLLAIEQEFGEFKYGKTKSAAKVDAHTFARGVAVGQKIDVNRRGIEGGQGNTAAVPTARRLEG